MAFFKAHPKLLGAAEVISRGPVVTCQWRQALTISATFLERRHTSASLHFRARPHFEKDKKPSCSPRGQACELSGLTILGHNELASRIVLNVACPLDLSPKNG